MQAVIRDYCSATGFLRHELVLELAHVWPSHRHRWWCLLVHPAIKGVKLVPWSVDAKFTCISQVVDCFRIAEADCDQLALSEYEEEQFAARKPLHAYCLRTNARLQTALHSWGSQVFACPCGCRKAFTADRLDRGISGVLVPFTGAQGTLKFRHLHPQELAVLLGCPLGAAFGASLRLGLALLGQCASPLQSVWILSQLDACIRGLPSPVVAAQQRLDEVRAGLLLQAKQAGLLSEQGAQKGLALLRGTGDLSPPASQAPSAVAVSAPVIDPLPNPCFSLPGLPLTHASVHSVASASFPSPCSAPPGLPLTRVDHAEVGAARRSGDAFLAVPVPGGEACAGPGSGAIVSRASAVAPCFAQVQVHGGPVVDSPRAHARLPLGSAEDGHSLHPASLKRDFTGEGLTPGRHAAVSPRSDGGLSAEFSRTAGSALHYPNPCLCIANPSLTRVQVSPPAGGPGLNTEPRAASHGDAQAKSGAVGKKFSPKSPSSVFAPHGLLFVICCTGCQALLPAVALTAGRGRRPLNLKVRPRYRSP